jgi:TolA-binding protein
MISRFTRSNPRLSSVAAAGLLLVTGGGCWVTSKQGERIQEANDSQDRAIEALRADLNAEREQLADKMAKLEEMTQKAASVVTRDSADRGVQIDQMQERIALLEGQLAELRYSLEKLSGEAAARQADIEKRIEQLARKTGIDSPISVEDIPRDKNAHFQAGREAFDAGDHPRSRALLREYLARYPDDDRADDAQYLIGAGYLQEGKPATALGEFRKVISQYGKGDALAGALLGMAEAFFKLNACTDAKKALDALLQRKPGRDIKRKIEQKLREINSAPPNYCTS